MRHRQTDLKEPEAPPTAQAQVAAAESKVQKIVKRSVSGALMVGGALGVLAAGHVYLAALVAVLQGVLFKELVGVRYEAVKDKQLALFRTLQWGYFAVALLVSYGDAFRDFMATRHPDSAAAAAVARYLHPAAFALYSGVFVATVLTLKKGHIRAQLSELAWTVLVLAVVVLQLGRCVHNITAGLFFFALPAALVVVNDVLAYVCGMLWGRKLLQRPFLPTLSPNKTWEGFLGAAVLTVAVAPFLAEALAVPYFYCPLQSLSQAGPLACEPSPAFVPSIAVATTASGGAVLLRPVQLHAMALALVASSVAPFGGFLFSSIKRAFGKKDFGDLIPGHGGVADRLDCQLIMQLCAFVYHSWLESGMGMSDAALVAMAGRVARECAARGLSC